MGRDGGTGIGHCYPPRMPNLTIRVGDLNLLPGWKGRGAANGRGGTPPAAAAVTADPLPMERRRDLGPLGDLKTGVGYEHHTSHPAPGELLIYTGDLSEARSSSRTAPARSRSKLGQLAGNHFATLPSRRRLARSPARGRPPRPLGRGPGDRDRRGLADGPGMGSWFIAALDVLVVVLTTRGTDRGGSTAGHYDADAIGGYTMDPRHAGLPLRPPDLATRSAGSRRARSATSPQIRRRRPTDPGG